MQEQEFPDALPLGVVVGGYRLTRVIGQGGFGITYEAVNAAGLTERRVAVKEFFPRGHAYRQGTEIRLSSSIDRATWVSVERRFEAEALKLVDAYDHPAIVRGENFVREHGSSFLIMEFVEGPSLAQWLASLPEPADEALVRTVMEPVLDAVAYLHGRDDMHRDISPHNILVRLERRGRKVLEPVLIDFGAAGEGLGLGRQSSVVVANQTYAPLEQLRPSTGTQGAYTDIYALGGVLYYCVAGKAPVPSEERAAALSMGRTDSAYVPAAELPVDGRFSASFLAGVDQAMSIRPQDRPQTVAELRAALGWAAAPDAAAPTSPDLTAIPNPAAGLARAAGLTGAVGLTGAGALTGAASAAASAPAAPSAGQPGDRKPGGRRASRIMGMIVLGLGVLAGAGWLITQRAPPPAATAPQLPSPTKESSRPSSTAASFGPEMDALLAACESGRSGDCNLAGVKFDAGLGVPKDDTRATELFLKACDGGKFVGCTRAAGSLTSGRGVPKDLKRATRLYIKSCDGAKDPIDCADAIRLIQAGAVSANDPDVASFLAWRCKAGYQDACKLVEASKEKKAGPSFWPQVDALLAACDRGNGTKCLEAALHFDNGIGVPKDSERATALYLKACEGGVPGGCTDAGVQYDQGRGVPADQKRATQLYLKACDGGNSLGCTYAGFQFDQGRGAPVDPKRAAMLYMKGCDRNNSQGCDNAVRFIASGTLSAGDAGVASFLTQRCTAGDRDACKLGEALKQKAAASSFGPEVDALLAACDRGDGDKCFRAGYSFDSGKGVPQDSKRATDLYVKACDNRSFAGCSNAGVQFQKGIGVPADQKRATELYVKACDGGNIAGCNDAGIQFDKGFGVSQDRKRATELFLKACERGNFKGCYNAAIQFDDGLGVPQDRERATELYLTACEGGNIAGCNDAGILFDEGLGVPRDRKRATELYLKACEGGNFRGCTNAGIQFDDGLGVSQNRERATGLYQKACEGGNATGCYNAAIHFDNGRGVPQDRKRATEFYMKACEGDENGKGCEDAVHLIKAGALSARDPKVMSFLTKRCAVFDLEACELKVP